MRVGVDIVKVERMEKLLRRKNLDSVFSETEQKRIHGFNRPLETASSYFAAKEALSKAMGVGIWKMGLDSVEILHDKLGKPYYHILNDSKIPYDMDSLDLTIAHDGDYCIATALLDDSPAPVRNDSEILLKRRKADSHKGDYGRVSLIGGSTGMSGSCYLSSTAALRSGVGLSYTVVPETISSILQIKSTENIILPIETGKEDFSEKYTGEVLNRIIKMDAVGIGPGLGSGSSLYPFVKGILENISVPAVVDADGLNAIAEDTSFLKNLQQDIIITPHPLEMARLSHTTVKDIEENREERAREFAYKHKITVLLKGHRTIITDGDGLFFNETGNPGMATAGSGDVLTGVILALLGQGYSSIEAGRIGAYIHGLAGDLAKEEMGETGMIASDMIQKLPFVFKALEEQDAY